MKQIEEEIMGFFLICISRKATWDNLDGGHFNQITLGRFFVIKTFLWERNTSSSFKVSQRWKHQDLMGLQMAFFRSFKDTIKDGLFLYVKNFC